MSIVAPVIPAREDVINEGKETLVLTPSYVHILRNGRATTVLSTQDIVGSRHRLDDKRKMCIVSYPNWRFTGKAKLVETLVQFASEAKALEWSAALLRHLNSPYAGHAHTVIEEPAPEAAPGGASTPGSTADPSAPSSSSPPSSSSVPSSSGPSSKRRKVLVLVNPFGGKKTAPKIWGKVAELFDLAGVACEVMETQRIGHASQIAHELDVDKYDGVVCVSGDGLLNEVVNGLVFRKDFYSVLARVAVGVIPAGSGNGLAASLGLSDPVAAALAIIKGHRKAIDLFSCAQQGRLPRFGFLSIEWSMIADIDIDSEKHRWMGSARFTYTAIGKVADPDSYKGRFVCFHEPAPVDDRPDTGVDAVSGAAAAAMRCAEESVVARLSPDVPLIDLDKDQRTRSLDIDGDFRWWLAMNVSHMSADAVGAKTARASDGFLDITFAQKANRKELTGILLSLDPPGKLHLEKTVTHFKVPEFYLAPDPACRHPGKLVIDGEVMPLAPIHVLCHRALATVYARRL